jgi:hypothetical protein
MFKALTLIFITATQAQALNTCGVSRMGCPWGQAAISEMERRLVTAST